MVQADLDAVHGSEIASLDVCVCYNLKYAAYALLSEQGLSDPNGSQSSYRNFESPVKAPVLLAPTAAHQLHKFNTDRINCIYQSQR